MNICIIQARLGSERLPEKVLMDIGEISLLKQVVDRCKRITGVDSVIVAIPESIKDDKLERWCAEQSIECFRGSETNVLDRFYSLSHKLNPKYIFRVTADCPFVDYELASYCLKCMINNPESELVRLEGDYPRGVFAELFTFEALKKINNLAYEERHFEHVTYFAFENKNMFNWLSIDSSQFYRDYTFRLTIDVEDDLKMIKEIKKNLKNPYVGLDEVIEYLINNPDVVKVNHHIRQKEIV